MGGGYSCLGPTVNARHSKLQYQSSLQRMSLSSSWATSFTRTRPHAIRTFGVCRLVEPFARFVGVVWFPSYAQHEGVLSRYRQQKRVSYWWAADQRAQAPSLWRRGLRCHTLLMGTCRRRFSHSSSGFGGVRGSVTVRGLTTRSTGPAGTGLLFGERRSRRAG